MRRILMMLAGVGLFTQAHAFPCYITMVKDSCWTDYNVKVDVVDTANKQVIAAMSMPAGKSWDRKEISCQPMQTVMLQATYAPAFWAKDENKIFYGTRYWSFPEEIKPGQAAWNMIICYASDFQATSLPPNATGHCTCDTKNIPAIVPH